MDISQLLHVKPEKITSLRSVISGELKEKGEKIVIPTNVANIDKLLCGGFRFGQKYLIFGSNKTGKTQLCHHLCVQSYAHSQYSNKAVNHVKNDTPQSSPNTIYYLDLENTFRPERIQEIAKEWSLDAQDVLKNIQVAEIMGNAVFLLKLRQLEESGLIQPYSVLIIDSLNIYYRAGQKQEETSFFQVKNEFLKILKIIDRLTRELHLLTIATAQISPRFTEKELIKEYPVGNQYINHFFSEYLYLSRVPSEKGELHFMHVANSLSLKERRLRYSIAPSGIIDPKL